MVCRSLRIDQLSIFQKMRIGIVIIKWAEVVIVLIQLQHFINILFGRLI